jgi:hypothetical protein
MDLRMLFGALFVALCNGLDDEARGRALGMLEHFANSETFSLAEKDTLFTMLKMANDVFSHAGERKIERDRSHLRVIN